MNAVDSLVSDKATLGESWIHAASFAERICNRSSTDQLDADQEALAQKRLSRWRRRAAFPEPALWEAFLHNHGIDESALKQLLIESAETLQAQHENTPEWVARIESTFRHNTPPSTNLTSDFQPFIDPLLAVAERALRKSIATCPSQHIALEPVIRQLLTSLAKSLYALIKPALTLEKHALDLQSTLDGADTVDFAHKLNDSAFIFKILREYPVLARALDDYVADWVSARGRFLLRLAADWQTIVATLPAISEADQVTAVDDQVSDPHCDGERVVILTVTSGGKFVYKPKSLAIDAAFQGLVHWINRAGFAPQLRAITLLDQQTHGWVEFVHAAGCDDVASLQRFFTRQGGLLALLYVIRGTDFHYENVIAAGEHPMLIDLESLLHPDFRYATGDAGETAVAEQFRNSVMGTSLLPHREAKGGDNGGMGHAENAIVPALGQNLPRLNGKAVDMLRFSAEFQAGFAQMYYLLKKNRSHLLSANSPLDAFANAPIRIVLRSSVVYDALLRNLSKPNQLRSGVAQARLLTLLWSAAKDHPTLKHAILHEERDLLRNNIPYFYTTPTSCDLYAADGSLIPDFFDQSGLDAVRVRLTQLSDADFATQQWFTTAALATLVTDLDHWSMPLHPLVETADSSAELAKSLAVQVGEQLERRMLGKADSVGWIGLNMDASSRAGWFLHPVDVDLQNGLSGIALFFAHLGQAIGDAHWTTLARKTTNSLLYWTETLIDGINSPGLHDGWGGIVLALARLGTLWRDDRLHDAATQVSNALSDTLEKTDDLSLGCGLSGAALGLLELAAATQSPQVIALAQRVLEQLLADTTALAELPDGLATGKAGVMLVLAAGGRLLNEPRYAQAAQQLAEDVMATHHVAGCSVRDGWAGVGIAAAAADSAELLQQATDAVLRDGFGRNHSLIHGDLGSLDFLLSSHPNTKLGHRLINTIAHSGPACGVPFGLPTPGLLHGLAGIGYGLLRYSQPNKLCSIWTVSADTPLAATSTSQQGEFSNALSV